MWSTPICSSAHPVVESVCLPISAKRFVFCPPRVRASRRRHAARVPPMIYVAGVLGLRWSELAGLRAGRVELVERRLAVLETLAEVEGRVSFADVTSPASRRVISMPGFISRMLGKHLLRRGRPV